MITYTGTFDIQNVSTTVRVCFTCTFIEGSQHSIDVLSPSIMSSSVKLSSSSSVKLSKSSSQREATTIVPTSSEYPTNGRQPCTHEH